MAQHFPIYLTADGRTWLVIGWLPAVDSRLPRQPVVLLCDENTQEPRVLEQTTPFRVIGTGDHPVPSSAMIGSARA
jgi:hypothetical protein